MIDDARVNRGVNLIKYWFRQRPVSAGETRWVYYTQRHRLVYLSLLFTIFLRSAKMMSPPKRSAAYSP